MISTLLNEKFKKKKETTEKRKNLMIVVRGGRSVSGVGKRGGGTGREKKTPGVRKGRMEASPL